MKDSLVIPLAIVAGGVIIATAVYFSIPKNTPADPRIASSLLVRPVGTGDHILGNPAAPVMIVTYSDFDCEFCRIFNDTLHQIIATEAPTSNVAFIFRHFPLSEIHPNALSHARAAECAGTVGGSDAFWKFANALFANQPVLPASYGTLAASVGISGDAFATCYATASSTLEARIAADRQNALDIGARGTPYSLILSSGKTPVIVDGSYSYDDLKMLIDQAIGE